MRVKVHKEDKYCSFTLIDFFVIILHNMTQSSSFLYHSSKLVAKFVHKNFTMSKCSNESLDEDYADFQTEISDSDISLPSSSPSSSKDDKEKIPPKRRYVRTRGRAAKRTQENPTKVGHRIQFFLKP